MREIDLEAEVISGLDEGKPQRPLTTPALPLVDNPLDELEVNSGLADETIERLQADAFVADACGLESSEVRKIVARESEPVTFAKTLGNEKRMEELSARFERIISAEVHSALIPIRGSLIVEKRKADLAKGAPARRTALTKLLAPLRGLFQEITPLREKQFDRLTDEMTAFVTQRILDEA
jgi:hypothetical protein